MSNIDVDGLVAALHHRDWLALDASQVSLLMGWLGRSERSADLELLERKLGPAGDEPELLESAFALLDALLFEGERLRESVAGVGPERELDQRRRRYRLLLSVFHPDRFPGHAEWLTGRSQIITRAYGRFKSGETDPEPSPSRLRTETVDQAPNARPPWRGVTPNWRIATRMRLRLGRDRFLAHKIIGGMLLLAILPVISMLLDSDPPPTDFPPELLAAPTQQWVGAELDIALNDWPVAPLDPPWLRPRPRSFDTPRHEPWPLAQPFPDWLQAAVVVNRPNPLAGPEIATAPPAEVTNREHRNAEREDVLANQAPDVQRNALPGPISAPAVGDEQPLVETARSRPRSEPAGSEEELVATPVAGPANGSLSLGPLANHQAGQLLDQYRRSVERGDVAGVLKALGRNPRQNGHQGRDWFERRYTDLFQATDHRALSLQVTSARRVGNDWLVEVDYLLKMIPANQQSAEQRQYRLRYSISPDPFGLKIISIDEQ